MKQLDTQFVRGPDAESLVADSSFVGQWSQLVGQCPWATGFQTPGYVRTWYTAYRERFEPLLVLSHGPAGDLRGLLTLAASRTDGRLVVAGDVQAEYQVWISPPELGDDFPLRAWRRLREAFPSVSLKLSYLPPGTPKGWLAHAEVKSCLLLRAHARPLLQFDDGRQIAASLAKKSNKNRLRQLEKLGPVTFTRVNEPAERERLFDELIPYHDVRHAAMRGSSPFTSDPLMRRFGAALLGVPDLLHVTVLRCGERFASAHIGLLNNRREVELGLMAHNPWLARYSPGKFHILFLARMLREEGYERIDLTAGGDAYKERFASAWDEVHTLTLFPSRLARGAGRAREGLKRGARQLLSTVRVTPNRARAFVTRLRELRPAAIAGTIVRAAGGRRAASADASDDAVEFGASAWEADAPPMRRDCLADLLCYRPAPGGPNRRDFLAAALRRIEEGLHVYTRVANDGRLVQVEWRTDRGAESKTNRARGDRATTSHCAEPCLASPSTG